MLGALMTRFPWFLSALVLATSCSRKPEPDSRPSAGASSAAALGTAGSSTNAAAPKVQVVWSDPPGWERIPPTSPMRKAVYRIPKASSDPEDGELVVFHFGRREGGDTEANIQRWIAQFSDAKPSDIKRGERTSNSLKQTTVEIQGTFTGSGMPGSAPTAKANYRLMGAVVETPAGSYFFKLTGPKKTVEGARDSFYSLLESVRVG